MKYIYIIFAFFVLNACREESGEESSVSYHKWYDKTKLQILKAANASFNDSCCGEYDCEMFNEMHYFFNGEQFLVKEYKNGRLYIERRYADKYHFELRKKFHPNGHLASEGILYNGSYYGTYKKWYENGKLQELGIKYNGNYMGKHKIWSRSGTCTEITEPVKMDVSMPDISE